MSFDSFAEFLHMGGHALYVWLSYGLGAVIIVVNVVAPARARRRFIAVEAERARRTEITRESDAPGTT